MLTHPAATSRSLPQDPHRRVPLGSAENTGNDIDEFRRSVEQWYDDHMARVSGWYKRHVRWVSLAIGFVLVVNINTVTVARALYTDEALASP